MPVPIQFGLGAFAAVLLVVVSSSVISSISAEEEPLHGQSPEAALAVLNGDPALAARLERKEMSVSYAPPAKSLEDALDGIELVVRGRVTAVRFSADYWTYATFELTSVLKGDVKAGDTITLVQMGGAETSRDHGSWTTALVEPIAAPLLLLGDEAILFLTAAAPEHGSDSYWPRVFTGLYPIKDGRVRAIEHNPFASLVENKAPIDVEQIISARVR